MNGKRLTAPQVSWVYPEHRHLKKEDTILSIDGKVVQGRGDLNAYLSTLNPGTRVELEVWRRGESRTLVLDTESLPNAVVDMALEEVLGVQLSVRQSTVQIARVASQGAFARNGLKAGDQLLVSEWSKSTNSRRCQNDPQQCQE